MVLFAFALALMSLLLLALPILRMAKQALPIGPSPARGINGREIDGAMTDREVEVLIREELYGQRLNGSRR